MYWPRINYVKKLVKLFEEPNIDELETGNFLCGVNVKRRNSNNSKKQTIIYQYPTQQPQETLTEKVEEIPKSKDNQVIIYSDRPGWFHIRDPKTNKSYVKVGEEVEPGQVLGTILVLNQSIEIKSEVQGILEEILSKEGKPIEYKTPLFKIKTQ
ncbi:MAG: biotin/lipoyl-containing protein [Candidatus Woesearchaeota archaeon]